MSFDALLFASTDYAAFFSWVLTFAHLARCAAAIFLRAEADKMCFTGAETVVFAIGTTGCDPLLALAHRARCACAILRRDACDITRVGWAAFSKDPEPFNDSITEIAWSMLSTRGALPRPPPPLVFTVSPKRCGIPDVRPAIRLRHE